jgi:drug/metabolite transporter (DMT)-like permease
MLYMLLAGLLFVLMDTGGKYLAERYPIIEVTWARYVFHVAALPFIAGKLDWVAFMRTRRLGLQLGRSALMMLTAVLFFLAVRHIPLATATAIGFAAPLFLTALAVPMLGEEVGWRRWSAVIVGFLGTLAIIRPGQDMVHWAMALPLATALCFALYQIATRKLGPGEPWETTLFYTAAPGALLSSLLLPFGWRWPGAFDWVVMVLVGLLGALSHMAIIKALALAPASTLAPFSYVQLVWAGIFGMIAFGDVPGSWDLAGAGIIVGSGLYVLYRERLVRKRA